MRIMDPILPPAASTTPEVPGQPVVEFMRENRPLAGYAALALSIIFLGCTIFCGVKYFPDRSVARPASETKLDMDSLETPKAESADPKRIDYLIAGLGT